MANIRAGEPLGEADIVRLFRARGAAFNEVCRAADRLRQRVEANEITLRVAEVYLPMNRSDIGDYVGMSLEAVSRSFRSLASRGIITFRDRRHVKIISHSQLESIASESGMRELRGRPTRSD